MSLYINDKTTGKINSISGQQRVDKELNINSENPVENKAISSKLEELDSALDEKIDKQCFYRYNCCSR